jgi:hypothetical protein
MTCEKSVDPALIEIELRKCKIVQVRVHLIAWPGEIHKIAKSVEGYYQQSNISTW